MNQKIIIESLAMDLKRVAIGLHRGSYAMAERFKQESAKRYSQLENQKIDSYLEFLLKRSKEVLNNNNDRLSEDALMYSTLFQNFAVKRL